MRDDLAGRAHWRDCDPSRGRKTCGLWFLAPLVGAALGLGASAISANSTKKATTAAVNAQNTATQASTAANDRNLTYLQGVRDDTKSTLAPYIGQGSSFNPQVNALLANNPFKTETGATFETDPHYNWLQNEAMRGVNAGFGDAVHSGGRLKALQDRAGMVAQNYRNDWDNRNQINLGNYNNAQGQYINALTGQQQQGLSAANALAGVSTNIAGQVVNTNNNQAANIGNQANATSNAALVNGQNTNSLMSGITNFAGNFLGQGGFGQQRQSSYAPPPAPPMQGWTPQNNYLNPVY